MTTGQSFSDQPDEPLPTKFGDYPDCDQSTRLAAAYWFGYRTFAVWIIREDTIFELILSSLKSEVIILADEIDLKVLTILLQQLEFILNNFKVWFEENGYSSRNKYNGFNKYDWFALLSLSDRALNVGSTLRKWYNLGQAFGRFDLHRGDSSDTTHPDYRLIADAVRDMPPDALAQIPVLRRLLKDADEYDRLGKDRFFREVIGDIQSYRHSIGTDMDKTLPGIEVVHGRATDFGSLEVGAKPSWDKDSYQLKLNGKTIRKVRAIGENVVQLLDVFEREKWPRKIEDPLPSAEGQQNDAQRLSDTVKSLNKNLLMIKFHMDGTGRGVCWEFADREPS